jgi:hypothetical protein
MWSIAPQITRLKVVEDEEAVIEDEEAVVCVRKAEGEPPRVSRKD